MGFVNEWQWIQMIQVCIRSRILGFVTGNVESSRCANVMLAIVAYLPKARKLWSRRNSRCYLTAPK
jgi:hypothetical protein